MKNFTKILFSPIGTTDPISNFKDGSMLHICRVYKPDKVILYLSKEMVGYHKQDNRYDFCLEKMSEFIGKEIEVEYILDEDMENVQNHDVFYNKYYKIIENIKSKYVDSELYVNISSGTPAMKNALLILAALSEFSFTPVQVSTPVKRSNPRAENIINYEVEEYWDLNEDNDVNFEDRSSIPNIHNFTGLMKINQIKKLIEVYDYSAACVILEEIKDVISSKAYDLVKVAKDRFQLNLGNVDKVAREHNISITPVNSGNQKMLFEYALTLDVKRKREEYGDYLRAITPLLDDLIETILSLKCGIRISDYYSDLTTNSRNNRNCDNQDKRISYEKASTNQDLLNELNLMPGEKKYITTANMINIIANKTNDTSLKNLMQNVFKINREARNIAAHEVESINDTWIKNKTDFNSNQIFNIIKQLFTYAGFSISKEKWNSYDDMNDLIIKELSL